MASNNAINPSLKLSNTQSAPVRNSGSFTDLPIESSADLIIPVSTIPTVRFRQFNSGDAQQVRALCEVWSDAFDDKRRWKCRYRDSDIRSKVQSIEIYKRDHPEKLKGICVAMERDQVIGGVSVYLHDQYGDDQLPEFMRHICKEKEAYIEWIGVNANARGKGIGKGLLQFSDNYARANGCDRISLDVVKGNNRAKALYERWGYEEQFNARDDPECCVTCSVCCFMGYCGLHLMRKSLTVDL